MSNKEIFDNLFKEKLDKLALGRSTQELRELKSSLSQYIGDTISDHLLKLQERDREKNFLWSMSDDEFASYLKNKYSKNSDGTPNVLWAMRTSLTKEEFERYAPLAKKATEKVMKEIEKTREYRLPPYQRRKWF